VNVTILYNDLLVVILDEPLELFNDTHFEFLMIVNVLSDPVHSIFETPDVALILSNLGIGCTDSSLHIFLLKSEFFDNKT